MNLADELAPRQPSMSALEQRVHHLELTVATLAEALRVLARGLQDGPMSEPGEPIVAEAARRAHDLLLAPEAAPTLNAQKSGNQ